MKPPKTHTYYYYYYYKALSLLLSLHLFLAMSECFLHKQPTHFSRATLRLLEKDVVYNWIGLLRTYTRRLLLTFLLIDSINCIIFSEKLRNNQAYLY